MPTLSNKQTDDATNQKLVDDGVITVDPDGTIRLTKEAWLRMTDATSHIVHSPPPPSPHQPHPHRSKNHERD